MTADRGRVHGFVGEEPFEHGHRLVNVGVRDDPHAAAVMFLMNDVMVEGMVRHRQKPLPAPEEGRGCLITT